MTHSASAINRKGGYEQDFLCTWRGSCTAVLGDCAGADCRRSETAMPSKMSVTSSSSSGASARNGACGG